MRLPRLPRSPLESATIPNIKDKMKLSETKDLGLPGFEPGSQGPKPRRLTRLPHNPIFLKEKHAIFKSFHKTKNL